MRTQIAKTTKEVKVKLAFHADEVTVPVGTEVKKVHGGVGYELCWWVEDFSFITDPLVRAQAEHAGIPIPDDQMELPEER